MKKKIITLILSAIILLSIFPFSAFAEESLVTSGVCGENVAWSFNNSTGTLTISGIGDMLDYHLGSIPWKDYKSSITEIIFDGEITYIGSHAFCGLKNITEINIPETVTKIGQSAFNNCSSLEAVTIPDSVTTLDGYVFADCTNLKEVVFGKGLTETGDSAFSGCEKLKKVIIPDNIKVISDSTFWFCVGLESVDFPETLIEISEAAFEHCQSLKTVSIPASVESIGAYAFASCTSLTEILVDKNNEYFCNDKYGVLFNKEKTLLKQYPAGRTDAMYSVLYPVRIIGRGAFAEADFTTVTLPSSLTAINEWAFDSCYNLKRIYLRTKLNRIGRYAFYSCHKLSDVFYTGHQYQFDNIEIDTNNDTLTKASLHLLYTCEAEHTLTDWILYDGPCESKERELRFCIYCADGNKQRYTGNIVQHKITDWEVIKEPTCKSEGEELGYCEKCDKEETRYTDKASHTPANAVEENYIAPTVSKDGSKDIVIYCSVCDEEISRETVVVKHEENITFTGIKDNHFYKNDVMQKAYQLVEFEGDFYYIGDRHEIIKGRKAYVKADRINGLTYADGAPIEAGWYEFDEDGKMIMLNGVVDNHIYINNTMLKAYQLVEVDGDIYYIGDRHEIIKGRKAYVKADRINGLTYEDGTPITAGYYEFDENGKMVILNGVVDNKIYKNNVQLKAYQLVEVDGDIYYIGDRQRNY